MHRKTSLYNSHLLVTFASLCLLNTSPMCVSAEEYQPPESLQQIIKKNKIKVSFKIEKQLDGFSLANVKGVVQISAPTPDLLIAGYGFFLKHYQNMHWSWCESRTTHVSPRPLPQEKIYVPASWSWRYAYNYCTLSYTSAFWGKQEWSEELDRMALHGINYMLVQAGLEKVWQLTLEEIGYPKDKIAKFIPNPAFAAWWNMGNLEGHGGPLTQRQIEQEADLGRFIVKRMESYGLTPVLQGFVGLVPADLHQYYKKGDARYIPQGQWCDGFVRPAVLDPTTEAFQELSKIWYKNLKKVYGIEAKVFGGDLFHEGGKSGGIDITQAAKSVQRAMQTAVPGSTWLIQSWGHNPSAKLLSGLDNDKCMVLALCKNLVNGTDGHRLRYYDGKPWIWAELLNFGGNQGLYGSLQVLANIGDLQKAKGKNELSGLGMISEGTEQNPIYYDLFFDRLWISKQKNMNEKELADWIAKYSLRRYGQKNHQVVKALKILERSVYRPKRDQEGCTESILCARPGRNVQKASTWATGNVYYSPKEVYTALTLFVQAAENNPALLKEKTFRFDLIDLTRQYLSDMARPLLEQTMDLYDTGNLKEFEQSANLFLGLISATDDVLGTLPMWRFGRMYEQAEAKGVTIEEKENNTTALKMLCTTWSGRIGGLNDYSHRQLSGLMKDFYGQRWNLFFAAHRQALQGNLPKNQVNNHFRNQVHQFELAWPKSKTSYSAKAQGNTLREVKKVLAKYQKLSEQLFKDKPAVIGKKWTLRDGVSELEFDVSEDLMTAGTYLITFKYQKGAHALKIFGVKLYEGDKLVAEDPHEGWTGVENRQNQYTVKLDKIRTNLDAYKIKARVEGSGGNDSSGEFTIKKIK